MKFGDIIPIKVKFVAGEGCFRCCFDSYRCNNLPKQADSADCCSGHFEFVREGEDDE